MGRDDWLYLVYGRSLNRKVVPLPRAATLSAAERLGLRWVVLSRVARGRSRAGWSRIELGKSGWKLLARADHPFSAASVGVKGSRPSAASS